MITKQEYTMFDEAFEHFNKKIFGGELPECLITLQRKSRSRGYHHHERLQARGGSDKLTEIALNPDCFDGRSDMEILSTLAHEMVHLWEYFVTDGNPSRPGYHNKMWADKMEEIGLMPSHTGEEGGKRTGQSMTHYILRGGDFEKHCGAFLARGKRLGWESPALVASEKEPRKKTREKFVCPTCLQNAWAKPTANLMCGDDETTMIIDEG